MLYPTCLGPGNLIKGMKKERQWTPKSWSQTDFSDFSDGVVTITVATWCLYVLTMSSKVGKS